MPNSDCYASAWVSAPCATCGAHDIRPGAITHVVAEVFYCSSCCVICAAEGERRRGAKKGGQE